MPIYDRYNLEKLKFRIQSMEELPKTLFNGCITNFSSKMVDSSVCDKYELYGNPSLLRYGREIEKVKQGKEGPYAVSDFSGFDSLSYCGHSSMQSFTDSLSLTSDSTVLDLCSGLGATSRFIASRYTSNVYSVDFIKGLHDLHQEINTLCEINKIRCFHADATSLDLASIGIEGKCDLVYSLQSFYYIKNKESLFNVCNQALKNGACLYIEDHIRLNDLELTQEEEEVCEKFLFNHQLTREEYEVLLTNAGFEVVSFELKSVEFARYVYHRAEEWAKKRDLIIEEFGDEYWTTRIVSGIYNSLRLYHDLHMTQQEVKEAYPHLVQLVGEREIERWISMPFKFTGAYIRARKIRSSS